MSPKRRRYDAAYRSETVRLVLKEKVPQSRVSRDLGVPESSLSRWVHQAQVDAGRGKAGALTTDERAELTQKASTAVLHMPALEVNGLLGDLDA